MKNIFNHNHRTSLLKSSLRAKRGNLFTSIHSFQSSFNIFDFKLSTINHKLSTLIPAHQRTSISSKLSTFFASSRRLLISFIFSEHKAHGSRRKAHGVFFPQLSTINYKLLTLFAHGMLALLFFSVMLIQSGCSLTADRYIERSLGNNSICWEDNDHILIYANIAQYWYSQSIVGGESKEYDWVGGEIWRITASTGAKELLFRGKESTYYAHGWPEDMRMTIVNGNVYTCNQLKTYKVREDYSEWDSIGYFTLPIISDDENTVVAYDTEEYSTVKRYNLENNTSEDLYVNDVLIEWLDYDYERNYLLINSNKFVDLNTGEEVIVCESGDSIEEYVVSYDNMAKGSIEENYLTMDVSVYNVADISKDYRYRLKIDINDFNDKYLVKNVNGTLSPDKKTYAVPGLFTDTLGDTISQWSIPFDEL